MKKSKRQPEEPLDPIERASIRIADIRKAYGDVSQAIASCQAEPKKESDYFTAPVAHLTPESFKAPSVDSTETEL